MPLRRKKTIPKYLLNIRHNSTIYKFIYLNQTAHHVIKAIGIVCAPNCPSSSTTCSIPRVRLALSAEGQP